MPGAVTLPQSQSDQSLNPPLGTNGSRPPWSYLAICAYLKAGEFLGQAPPPCAPHRNGNSNSLLVRNQKSKANPRPHGNLTSPALKVHFLKPGGGGRGHRPLSLTTTPSFKQIGKAKDGLLDTEAQREHDADIQRGERRQQREVRHCHRGGATHNPRRAEGQGNQTR